MLAAKEYTRTDILLDKTVKNKRTDLLQKKTADCLLPGGNSSPSPSPVPKFMAEPRVFTDADSEAGVYHVVSRVVDRRFVFESAEKEFFVRMMRAVAAFHQVEVLTFCKRHPEHH
jgi:hypothetical protein